MRIPVLILLAGISLPSLAQAVAKPSPEVRLSESSPAEGSDETAKKLKVEETIVVTATRSERALSELPVSTAVIREEEIATSPAVHVDDVLRSVPGIQLPVNGSATTFTMQSRVSMHGLGTIGALVLLDGIPLHDPFDGTVHWNRVPAEDLRQVEVVRGASASLFGNYALGGTIGLISRPVGEDRISVDASAGSAETTRGLVTIDHRPRPDLGLRFSHVRHDTAGFVKVVDPGPLDRPTWYDSAITALRADWDPTGTTSAFLKANRSDVNMSNGTPASWSNRDILDFAAGAHRTIGERMLLTGRLFHLRSTEHLILSSVAADRASESVTSDSDIPATATGGSLEWALHRSGSIPFVSFGIDVQETAADEDRTTFNRSGVVVRRNLVEGRQVSSGLFGQASWQPDSRLEILASARLDVFRNTDGSDTVVGGAVTSYRAKTANQIDPRLSMRYRLAGRTVLRASAYRAFKAPTLRQLYRNSQFGSQIILGNPNLEPETLNGAEAGVEWASSRTRFEVSVYRSVIDGFVVRTRAPGQPENITQNRNVGRIRAEGIELTASAQISRRWSLSSGYTYADSRIVDDPQPQLEGNRLPDVPQHTGLIGLRYVNERGTSVQLRGRVSSSSYSDSANAEPNSAQRVLDLSFSHPLLPWLDLQARLENAFDDAFYYGGAGIRRLGQPRSISGGVRLRFQSAGGTR